jgi:hypothetical protein
MASEKYQQVQVRTVAEYAQLGDNAANFFIIHIPLRSRAAPFARPDERRPDASHVSNAFAPWASIGSARDAPCCHVTCC